jgi:predicted alpha/beta hydrolase
MNERHLRIPALDGFPLAATVFESAAPAPRAVLIVPATGVVRRIYADYARHLAESGLIAVTWDWRGTGESRPASLRGFDATMSMWGHDDLGGVIRWANANLSANVSAVAHSFGGQALGLAPNSRELQRIVTVGCQIGYWRLWPAPLRYKYALLWYLVMPVVVRLAGRFPSRFFGLGEDLPKGVALEWASWCRSPEYLGAWQGHRAMDAPLLAVCFSDDIYAPRPAFEALHARYGSPVKVLRWISPVEVGRDYVGHFGFFRKGLVPQLWDETAGWLQAS